MPLGRFSQNASAPVLYVLLHDAFLPTGGSVAELVLEQVVARHRLKAGVDGTLFALAHFVDSRSHVVVDAALGHTAKDGKASGVCIKQHLVGLGEVGHQQECAACRQFDVGHIKAPS